MFYCTFGQRSTLAIKMAKSYEYNNCSHLIGGTTNWREVGLELDS